MAERWEIIIDFTAFKGQTIDMMNMRDVGADEDYAATDKVMRFTIGSTITDLTNNGATPANLRTLPFPPSKTTIDRTFKFERSNGEWQINGVTFSDIKNRILAKPQRGVLEVWELENSSGGWSHPIHIHLIDFRVISRTGGKRAVQPYEAEALKDVVWLGPNEKVKVLARWAPWDGVYSEFLPFFLPPLSHSIPFHSIPSPFSIPFLTLPPHIPKPPNPKPPIHHPLTNPSVPLPQPNPRRPRHDVRLQRHLPPQLELHRKNLLPRPHGNPLARKTVSTPRTEQQYRAG